MSVEKIYEYQERVDTALDRLDKQTTIYCDLIERIAELEVDVRRCCMEYFLAHEEAKKHSMEKCELFACTKPDAKEAYLELVFLRVKQHNLEKVLEASQSGLSAIQSLMKYDKAGGYEQRTT